MTTPALLTVVKDANQPRYPSISGIFDAYEVDVKKITNDDLKLEREELGLKGSPTKVVATTTPDTQRKGEVFTGNPKECCGNLIDRLNQRHLI